MADEILDMYRDALLIRKVEERLMELKDQGHIPGSVHLCVGEEAIPVGACRALEPRDALTCTYRGHGWALARGVDPAQIFAEIMGRDSDLSGGRGGSLFFSSAPHGLLGENSIVGGGVPIALGAALASRYTGDGAIALAAVGDGAVNQGAVHEALNFASAFSLPLVLIVENNYYSEMTPVHTMVNIDPLSSRAAAYGIPGHTIDGNDVLAVRDAVQEAVDRARQGQGPALIEAITQRLAGHYSGDLQHYRPRGEIDRAKQTEPLVRMRVAITQTPVGAERLAAVEAEVAEILLDAENRAFAIPWPDPATAQEHVYA